MSRPLVNASPVINYEYDANDNPVTFYVHGPKVDQPLAMLRDLNKNGKFGKDEVFYYTKDHLNSVRELLDFEGNIFQRYSYSAYGETKIAKHQDRTKQNFIENRYAFTGRELDQHTGFYYYRARYYDPNTGRFLSEDPIGFKGEDFNLYRYVLNNPINFSDPYGLLKYNTPDKDRTGPIEGETLDFALCMEKCAGFELTVTGGSEKTGHNSGSMHSSGKACDLGFNSNPNLTKKTASQCFSSCANPSYWGQTESNHFHFQTVPGKNGGTGFGGSRGNGVGGNGGTCPDKKCKK